MNLLTVLILVAVFLTVASLIMVLYGLWSAGKYAEKRLVKKRLLFISAGGRHGQEKLSRYRNLTLKEVGLLEQLIMRVPRLPSLDRMLVKSQLPLTATTFVLASLALGGIGFIVGRYFLPHLSGALALTLLALASPYLLLKATEHVYLRRFQEQLPEALDLLGRALRSGHALTSGLEMIVEETQDPIRSEFAATVDEIKLGLTLQEALDNLCARVPSTDLRFFAVAVTIQRETGGNLAEILDNISRLIRERAQFDRQLRALTAEGRLSAVILVAMPLVMFIYIYLVNYDYVALLWQEKAGLLMLSGAIILQIVGVLVMKRIVTIRI